MNSWNHPFFIKVVEHLNWILHMAFWQFFSKEIDMRWSCGKAWNQAGLVWYISRYLEETSMSITTPSTYTPNLHMKRLFIYYFNNNNIQRLRFITLLTFMILWQTLAYMFNRLHRREPIICFLQMLMQWVSLSYSCLY